jgi:hypothetical protein
MHLRISLRLGFLACLLGGAAAHVQAGTLVNYADFNFACNSNGLTCVGNAATTGGVLRVTPAAGGQSGAAYSSTALTLGANATFSTQFQFRFTNPGGADPADGITFVLAASPNGLGGSGYGMGYVGVGNSIAIEFDTYNNGNPGSLGFFAAEPNSSNHVSIDQNGILTNTAAANVYGNGSCGFSPGTPSQNPYTAAGCMSNGDTWTVNIGYDGSTQTLTTRLYDPAMGATFTALNNYPIDIAGLLGTNTVYAGFTGSSGAGWENQDILNWTLDSTTRLSGVPEPASPLLFSSGVLAFALLARRRLAAR